MYPPVSLPAHLQTILHTVHTPCIPQCHSQPTYRQSSIQYIHHVSPSVTPSPPTDNPPYSTYTMYPPVSLPAHLQTILHTVHTPCTPLCHSQPTYRQSSIQYIHHVPPCVTPS